MENVLNRIPEKKPLDKEATPSAQKRDKGDGGGSGRGDDPSKETTHEHCLRGRGSWMLTRCWLDHLSELCNCLLR